MDLRQLRHFLAVVEHGSILRAADAVHLTQPALSRSIQTLEAGLNVKLLERGRRGIEPTPHGLLLARHAQRLTSQADQAMAELHELRDEAAMRLAVGVGTHLAAFALPGIVARLLERLPALQVALSDGSAEELVAALRHGEIDVAVCAWPADGAPADLVFEEMFASDLVVVCRAAHPLARRRQVTLEELARRRWILAERPRAIGQVLRLAFAAAGLAAPDPVVRSTSLTFLHALLLEADLLSLLPAGFVREDLELRRLVRVRSDLPAATTRVGVLHRGEQQLRPVPLSFVEALRRELRPASSAAPHRRSVSRATPERR